MMSEFPTEHLRVLNRNNPVVHNPLVRPAVFWGGAVAALGRMGIDRFVPFVESLLERRRLNKAMEGWEGFNYCTGIRRMKPRNGDVITLSA